MNTRELVEGVGMEKHVSLVWVSSGSLDGMRIGRELGGNWRLMGVMGVMGDGGLTLRSSLLSKGIGIRPWAASSRSSSSDETGEIGSISFGPC